MEWFKELYDDFRMRTGFGNIPEDQTKKDVDFLIQELKLATGSKVLDLFCGTGRHSIEFTKRGIDAVGIEYNPDYLAAAQERASQASVHPKFIQGDVRDTDFGSEYDAAIVMWMSFGYFSDPEERLVLEKVFEALKPGGRFLMELLNRDFIIRNFSERDEKVIEGIKVIEERSFDVLTSRVNGTITRHEKDGPVVKRTSWRLYSTHELRNMLEEIGFSFVAGYGSLERQTLSLDTRLMRLVWEKRC
jgi:ubiquinone/menaquinone biosynthesis C-methylase UbiE